MASQLLIGLKSPNPTQITILIGIKTPTHAEIQSLSIYGLCASQPSIGQLVQIAFMLSQHAPTSTMSRQCAPASI